MSVSLDKDIDVGNRIYGSTVDIGADEWNGTDPTPVTPSVIYVKPSSQGGSDSNNGTTWTLAVATVQKGIDLAYSAGNCEVWVATGTYAKANLKSFVKFYGGFAVGDTSKSTRDWKTNQTILDGGASGAVVTISSAVGCVVDGFVIKNGSASYGGGVYCTSTVATVVDSIIRGNTASSYGGGLYASASNLTVAGNVFVDNKASSGSGIYYTTTNGQIANNTVIGNAATSDGGGIYLYSSSPALSNNIIASNAGGGIYKSSGSPTFTKNDVFGNSKYEYSWTTTYPVGTDLVPVDPGIPDIGWGDWHIASSSPCHDPTGTTLAVSLDKDIDVGNRVYGSTVDIGADEWNGTDPTPITPTVIYVKPFSQGGNDSDNGTSWSTAVATVQKGIDLAYAAGGAEVWVATGTYTVVTGQTYVANFKSFAHVFGGFVVGDTSKSARNWMTNQTVLSGRSSGAVVTMSSVTGCQIDGFTVQDGARGFSLSYAVGTISHNTIKGNGPSSNNGVGIYNNYSFSVIANNIIANNTASSGYYGGGVYLNYSNAKVLNNTIAQNTAPTAGGLYIYGGTPAMINNIVASNSSGVYLTGSTGVVPAYNDVWNNTGDTGSYWKPATTENGPPDTNGNIIKDPKFLDAVHMDFHIPWGSGCRDAGLDSVVLPDALDIDGQARRNGTIDIGADETTECCQYALILDPATQEVPAGSSATVTASVRNAATNQPAVGYQVDFSIDAGEIVSVTRSGTVVNLPSGTQSTYGVTDASGETEVVVRSQQECYVHVTGAITQCAQPDSKTVGIWFYTVEEADWPMFMHDPQHTGKSQTTDTTSETLTLAWSAEVQTATTTRDGTWSYHNQPGGSTAGYVFPHPSMDSSPVVVGNTVVVGTWTRGTSYSNATGSVVAFNAETGGSPLWTATGSPSMGGVASAPCIYNDSGTYKVYVGTTNGYLYCLNLATGAQLWAQPTTDRSSPAVQSKIIASPVIHDGIVYVGNEAAKVYAFDATTGTLQQGYPVSLPIEGHLATQPPTLQTKNMTGVSSPAVASVGDTDYLLLGCDDGYVYRFTLGISDPQSTLVGVNLGYYVESSPTVVGDNIYIGISRYQGNEFYGLSIEPLQMLTWTQVGEECRATPAYDFNGYLYIGVDTGHTFHKLLSSTLVEASKYTAPSGTCYFVGSAAVCGNGLVYVGNDDGTFRALTLSSLSQSASYSAGTGYICSSPAIAYNVDANHNRWVYVTSRNTNGKLLAFKTVR